MRIGFASPIFLRPLSPWLDLRPGERLPEGYGHAAPTQLALALLDAGHELEVVALDGSVTRPRSYRGPRLRVWVGAFRPCGRARDFFGSERRFVKEALQGTAPDLVHAHWSYEFALGALESGIPTLVTVRDWAPTIARLNPDPYRTVRLLMHGRTLASARFFTAPSPYIAGKVGRWRRVDVPVVPHSVADSAFSGPPRTTKSASCTIVGINNGFSPYKNVKTLLRAFPLVRDRIPEATLLLVGTGYEPGGEAQRWASDQQLLDGIDFVGPLPHHLIRALLEEADLFVHPSLEESFGMVVVEAMAQGVPVVAGTASGAIPWLLEDGAVGLLTRVRSPRLLADAVCAALEDPELWRRFSEGGRRSAWRRFRMTQSVLAYEKEYERVLTSTQGRRCG